MSVGEDHGKQTNDWLQRWGYSVGQRDQTRSEYIVCTSKIMSLAEEQKRDLLFLMLRCARACLICRLLPATCCCRGRHECTVSSGQALDISAPCKCALTTCGTEQSRCQTNSGNSNQAFFERRSRVERDWTCRWLRLTFLASALRPCSMRRLNSCHLKGS